MTDPSDPWSRRPDGNPVDGPTEKVGKAPGPFGHTSEPGEAYGSAETVNYQAPTEYFGQPPGPNPTQVFPQHDAGWGAYDSGTGYPPTATYESAQPGYGGGPLQYPPAPGGPGGYQPAGFPQQPGPQPPKKKTGLWIGLGLGAILLVALVGVLVGALLSDKDSADTASSGGTTSNNPLIIVPTKPGSGGTSSLPLPSGIPQIPGLGDIDDLGANMGTIASNDGKTLTITSLSGTTVTVKTDDKTQVISLGSTKVADLPVGEMVMVQGDKNTDGSIQAKIIISTSLPGGTR
ncbi:DUF5666 domain-containing protein [Nocardia yamanashiensis]|uniref:DUF5666 domain-containing protein n=1 Tax=Nocardia yamanashiensis TaxID=209247 RepID=UPI00082C8F20|nr:DUF5666 domain-containing protein [Nocardia yamanashiensis]